MVTKFLNGVDLANTKITSVASPSAASDAANKQYVDNVAAGLDPHPSVRVSSTANLTLTGTQTVDGVAVVVGDRVLVQNQTTSSQNGIYVVAAGAWTLAADSTTGNLTAGAFVTVEEGTVNDNKAFILTTNNPITVGTTPLAWSPFGAGTVYTAAANGGLLLTSSAFSILLDASPGLLLGAGGIKIDPAYSGLSKRYAANVTSGATTATMAHGLGTADLEVSVYDITVTPRAQVFPDVTVDATNIYIATAAVIASAALRVVAVG